ncbi:hypothetical protein [Deinococcus sonorensis]|uniref:HTH marR-type domain-containing protein n=2 Tax=Deinococcus sonorensis TaxID=309891 RepID=A0AAU7UCI3_9DEIO
MTLPSAGIVQHPPHRPSRRREAGTYTTTDRAVVDFQKQNGTATSRTLTVLAQRANFIHKAEVSVAEIQLETGLGQRAVEKALAALAELGFCTRTGRRWRYTTPNAGANGGANGGSLHHSPFDPQNIVLDGHQPALKEGEGAGRNIIRTVTSDELRQRHPRDDAAGSGPSTTKPDEDHPGLPTALDGLTGHPAQARRSANSSTPPGPFHAARDAINAAGLLPTWHDWVRLNRLHPVTQERQAPLWQAWIQQGLTEPLQAHVHDIIQSGSFAHPLGALRARMAKQLAPPPQSPGCGPTVRPGERRTAPDGRTWTVESVEYGLVYFEDVGAPADLGAAIVERWPLAGGAA